MAQLPPQKPSKHGLMDLNPAEELSPMQLDKSKDAPDQEDSISSAGSSLHNQSDSQDSSDSDNSSQDMGTPSLEEEPQKKRQRIAPKYLVYECRPEFCTQLRRWPDINHCPKCIWAFNCNYWATDVNTT